MLVPNLNVVHSSDGKTSFEKKCMLCGKVSGFVVDTEKYNWWLYGGEFIQNVFPHVSVDERERMISGTDTACFNKLFPPDPDECNGMCMTASDIGVPTPGNPVAYAHPDCPIHGDKS